MAFASVGKSGIPFEEEFRQEMRAAQGASAISSIPITFLFDPVRNCPIEDGKLEFAGVDPGDTIAQLKKRLCDEYAPIFEYNNLSIMLRGAELMDPLSLSDFPDIALARGQVELVVKWEFPENYDPVLLRESRDSLGMLEDGATSPLLPGAVSGVSDSPVFAAHSGVVGVSLQHGEMDRDKDKTRSKRRKNRRKSSGRAVPVGGAGVSASASSVSLNRTVSDNSETGSISHSYSATGGDADSSQSRPQPRADPNVNSYTEDDADVDVNIVTIGVGVSLEAEADSGVRQRRPGTGPPKIRPPPPPAPQLDAKSERLCDCVIL